MAIRLSKESLCLSTEACSRSMQTTVESDIIVPDIKPDILKILQVSSEVTITHREVQSSAVLVRGVVRMNVLYCPDNGIDGDIKSISTRQEFNHTMDVSGAMPEMQLFVDAEPEPAEYTLVNSRKLTLRTRISFSVRLMAQTDIHIATGVDEDCRIETKCKSIRLYNPGIDAVRDILLREKLEVPSGKPAICEVLKMTAKPYSIELKPLDGKAMAKGELKVCTLYCGEGEGGRPEVLEHTVPFGEMLEIDGLREDMEAEVDFRLKDIYFEVCQDSDGDRKLLSIEASLEAEVRAFEVVQCNVVEDAYSLSQPIRLERETYRIEELVASHTNREAIKETVAVPDYLPEVYCLCECTAVPTIENVCVDMGEVTVSGLVHCSFLYLSEDVSVPACSFSHILPFGQRLAAEGATGAAMCDAKAEIEHISCTISSGKCLEVRGIIATSVKVVEPMALELVSEISHDEDNVLPKMPSVSVYFVQKGDTLWSVAKKYRTSPDNIKLINGDNAENLKPGKCIYIFR